MDIDAYLQSANAYVMAAQDQWQPDRDVDFETLNHLLRVWIQAGCIADHTAQVRAICSAQHEDGGWGDRRDQPGSCGRTSAFCTQMLLRANRTLQEHAITASVLRGLDYLLSEQHADGSWPDKRWHQLDATSVSVGTLLFAVHEPYGHARHREALDRGMRFIAAARGADGLWYHKPTSSPVEITAHLLQKVGLYEADSAAIAPAISGLLARQSSDGHWDSRDVDSTCDALRSMMLTVQMAAGRSLLPQVSDAAERGLAWLGSVQAEDGGHGVRPGRPSRVLYTCDVVDTVLKFRAFQSHTCALAGFYR